MKLNTNFYIEIFEKETSWIEMIKDNLLNIYYLNGDGGYASLSKEYNIPYKTIDMWIYQYKHLNNDMKNHKKGRKKEENIDYKERYEILKKYQAFLKAQREKK